MAAGFIHDSLEIRLLILYIAARLESPVTADELQELTMIDDGINYFDFSVCLNDLVETGHLALEAGLYGITDKGVRNSEVCESGLPLSVRLRAEEELVRKNRELVQRKNVQSRIYRRDNGTYTVELHLRDELDSLMELSFMVANEAMARDLQERFTNDPESVYARILSVLYG